MMFYIVIALRHDFQLLPMVTRYKILDAAAVYKNDARVVLISVYFLWLNKYMYVYKYVYVCVYTLQC